MSMVNGKATTDYLRQFNNGLKVHFVVLNLMQEMLVETDALDKIGPSYDATLEIRAQDTPLCVSTACKGKLKFYVTG